MIDTIKKMNDEELESLIRERLKLNKHQRFDMSGYGENGSCHINNTEILNLFSDLGIYNRVKFLNLDAYKGMMTLYYAGWNDDEFRCDEKDLSGYGTVEIIKEILKLTVIDCSFPERRM